MVHNLKPTRQFEHGRVGVSKKHICRRERLLSVSRIGTHRQPGLKVVSSRIPIVSTPEMNCLPSSSWINEPRLPESSPADAFWDRSTAGDVGLYTRSSQVFFLGPTRKQL